MRYIATIGALASGLKLDAANKPQSLKAKFRWTRIPESAFFTVRNIIRVIAMSNIIFITYGI